MLVLRLIRGLAIGGSSLKILETLTSTGSLYDGGVGGSSRILRDRPGFLRDRDSCARTRSLRAPQARFFKIIDPKKKFRMNFKYRDVPKGSHPKDV